MAAMNAGSLRTLLPALVVGTLGLVGVAKLQGVPFWIAGAAASTGLLITTRSLLLTFGVPPRGTISLILLRLSMLLASVAFGFAVFETGLALIEVDLPMALLETPERGALVPERMRPDAIFAPANESGALHVVMPDDVMRKIEIMQSATTMPLAWEHRWIRKVDGKPLIFRWQGVEHVYDTDKIRKEGPFPPRVPERARILVIGDSFTYGKAIADFWSYPAQLERALASDFDVEVINLGSPGLASGEILELLGRYLPQLSPDLVFYGVCPNDFYDSGYKPGRDWRAPIPSGIKKFVIRKTRVGRFIADQYGRALLTLGLARDYYDDLLIDFESRTERFGRDVASMNALLAEQGLPPMIAMVVDIDTSSDERRQRLVTTVESQLHAANMRVIDSEPFITGFAGRNFIVSLWDRHPNEEANAIWAGILARYFRERPEITSHRKSADRTVDPE